MSRQALRSCVAPTIPPFHSKGGLRSTLVALLQGQACLRTRVPASRPHDGRLRPGLSLRLPQQQPQGRRRGRRLVGPLLPRRVRASLPLHCAPGGQRGSFRWSSARRTPRLPIRAGSFWPRATPGWGTTWAPSRRWRCWESRRQWLIVPAGRSTPPAWPRSPVRAPHFQGRAAGVRSSRSEGAACGAGGARRERVCRPGECHQLDQGVPAAERAAQGDALYAGVKSAAWRAAAGCVCGAALGRRQRGGVCMRF